MPSATFWNRLEPRGRSVDFAESLAARVFDPMWFLARQFQLNEYHGEDGGSAVVARLRGSASPLTRMRLGASNTSRPYDGHTPLEVLVEREPFRAEVPTARDAAEAGLLWLRMLEKRGFGAHRQKYIDHLPMAGHDPAADGGDPLSERFRNVLGGRVPDGAALYEQFDAALRPPGGSGVLPPVPDVGGDRTEVEDIARAWLSLWDAFASEPDAGESAWIPSKFEYRFAVAAPTEGGEHVLEAEEYVGGHLDWYTFRLQGGASLGASVDADQVQAVERTITPTSVDIPGNPTSRFWEFEDGRVDLARLNAAPEDLARLLLAEFALVYGDDWLFLPVDLDVGSVFRTDTLEVEDTFGTVTAIPASTASDTPDERWGFFHISEAPGAATPVKRPAPIFVLPPTLAAHLEGSPVEEVLLLRDEMANLAWAVERRVESSRGRGLDRGEVYQRRRAAAPEPPAPTGQAEIRYRMHGRLPDYWIPLMPVRTPESTRSIRFQRGSVPDPETGQFHRPLGRILVPGSPLFVDEEEIARAGATVTRAVQYARWEDGGVHVWMARRKRTRSGQGWSGLRFDQIESLSQGG